jgi:hypothetical protein
MQEHDDYFEEITLPEKKPRFKWPESTDTHGNVVKRPGPTAFARVLNDPVSMTSCGPYADVEDYALLFNEAIGIWIMRDGAKIRSAKFWLCSLDGHEACYVGAAGRDKAITRYIKMLKKGRVYGPPADEREEH